MKNLSKHIVDDKNGLSYTLHGDYYFPDLTIPEIDQKPIGHYGRIRLSYLRINHPGVYTHLLLSGKLYFHLDEIDSTCRERMRRMIPQMATAEEINEPLKDRDPMAWVAQMNSIRDRAEEMILAELIYT